MQFLLYLTYAHPAFWTLYYVEVMPVLAFLIALGMARVFQFFAKRASGGVTAPFGATVITAAAGLVAVVAVVRQVKNTLREDHSYYDAFTRLVSRIPDERAIVFVRYGDKHLDGLSLVRNVPDLAAAPVWTVYDRGPDNARLMALAPERAPYLFDEASWTLRRLQVASASTSKR